MPQICRISLWQLNVRCDGSLLLAPNRFAPRDCTLTEAHDYEECEYNIYFCAITYAEFSEIESRNIIIISCH